MLPTLCSSWQTKQGTQAAKSELNKPEGECLSRTLPPFKYVYRGFGWQIKNVWIPKQKPIQRVTIRWNFTYVMLEHLLRNKSPTANILADCLVTSTSMA